MYTIHDLYDLEHTLAKDYLSRFTYPWEALKGIKDLILTLGPTPVSIPPPVAATLSLQTASGGAAV